MSTSVRGIGFELLPNRKSSITYRDSISVLSKDERLMSLANSKDSCISMFNALIKSCAMLCVMVLIPFMNL
jgi:hypothetical protein